MARFLKCCKHWKIDKKNWQNKEIWSKQREENDYWDKYKDYNLESSLDKLKCNKLSLGLPSFEEEKEEEKSTYKSLEDNEERIPLENKKCIFKPI